MKNVFAIILIALASLNASCAGAGAVKKSSTQLDPLTLKTWIVLGTSISSLVAQGTPNQQYLQLVESERNISIRNLSSPGASLGSTDKTGYNNATTLNIITQISGAWGYYSGVIVEGGGTNDFKRGISVNNTIQGLRGILAKVRADNRKAIVMDAIYRDGENTPNGLADSLCLNTGNTLGCYRYYIRVVCVNEYPDVCHFASRDDTIMGAFNNNYDSSEVANSTRTHPNAVGNRHLADWLKAKAAAAGLF